MLNKIDHINIVVNDLQAAKEFFANLGFVIKREGRLEGNWIDTLTGLSDVKADFAALFLPGDSAALELLSFQNPPSPPDKNISNLNQTGFRHLAFQVDDIDSEVKKLQNKGIKMLSPVQAYEPLGKKLCYFHGPEGIILEMAEYQENHE